MKKYGTIKRARPYRDKAGRLWSYVRTSLNYYFSDKELIPLLKGDKTFLDGALEGKYTFINNRIMLKVPECLPLLVNPESFSNEYKYSNFLLAKAYNIYRCKQRVKKSVRVLAHREEKYRVMVQAGGPPVRYQKGVDSLYNDDSKISGNVEYIGVNARSGIRTTRNFAGLQHPEQFKSLGPVDHSVMLSYLQEEDASFTDKIEKYIQERHLTNEALAEKAGVDSRTIRRMRKEVGYRPKLKTIVAVCLSLHLFPHQSYQLIALAGYSFNQSKEEKVYCMLIDLLYTQDMTSINAFMLQFDIGNFEPKKSKSR